MTSIPDHLLQAFRERKPMPYKLELRPTDRCNLSCRHCWKRAWNESDFTYERELPLERHVEIIREAASIGVKDVELVGGGEPMYNSRASLTYFREIKEAGMHGDLVTNGTLFTDDMIHEMVEMGWDRIMFSIDGADAQTHDDLRARKGTFEQATTAMRRFTYWKLKLGSGKPFLGMVPVLTNRNHTQFSEFIELAHRLGTGHVGFKPLVVLHKGGADLQIADVQLEEMNHHILEAIPLAERYGIDTNLRSLIHRPGNEVVKKAKTLLELYEEDVRAVRTMLFRDMGLPVEEMSPRNPAEVYSNFSRFVQIPCFMPWYHLTITPYGEVSPCTGAGQLNPKPNVRDASLKEILAGDIFTRFRESLAKGEMPALCNGCCVGLFLDNRRFRAELIERGSHLLEKNAHG